MKRTFYALLFALFLAARVQAVSRNLRKQESTPQIVAFLLSRANVPARVGNGIYLRSEEVYSTDFAEGVTKRLKLRKYKSVTVLG
ncbi:hypothetical protein I8751_14730 [Nostocaceae cyanobacterium CENA357]|uniref:Uncharacterized protein n=1 Tax=Atlanticothrix silvestris CENA357 TaxID=1725252 RepID=A0A8J7HF11_9CYAN|nr:hypothetical protein [Atlanticothrix silvestris CENA357]